MGEEKLRQLQLYEQSLQTILAQKQQFQSQIAEFESALGELKKASESYRIIGNIMVKSDPKAVLKDIEEKQAALQLRLKALDRQEDSIKDKAKGLRQQVLEEMKHDKGNE
ncbi:prefoldin subunit beta [Candidatus Woesearchaeota archaeon]|nr:prefoldin subunit beta [Candidatus Woesearchaeota archaeon]